MKIPALGFGTYCCDGAITSCALERNYRLIDTATLYELVYIEATAITINKHSHHAYSNEAEVGRAIRKSGIPREQIYVVTKVFNVFNNL